MPIQKPSKGPARCRWAQTEESIVPSVDLVLFGDKLTATQVVLEIPDAAFCCAPRKLVTTQSSVLK